MIPVLPLIDLMLLAGWTSLLIGFVLKAVALATTYRPTLLGLTPSDFLMAGVAAMLFAIALAARTWVASQAPASTAQRRREETMDAYRALQRAGGGTAGAPPDVQAELAQAEQGPAPETVIRVSDEGVDRAS